MIYVERKVTAAVPLGHRPVRAWTAVVAAVPFDHFLWLQALEVGTLVALDILKDNAARPDKGERLHWRVVVAVHHFFVCCQKKGTKTPC